MDLNIFNAIGRGDDEEVGKLIKAGVDVNQRNPHINNYPPLFYAFIQNKYNIARMLLDTNRINVNELIHGDQTYLMSLGESYIHFYIEEFNTLVRMLIEKGVELNRVDNLGKTALIIAFQNGRYQIAKALINNGADINIRDNDGKSALWYAVRNILSLRDVDVIQMLLDRGADTNILDEDGSTLLMNTYSYTVLQFLLTRPEIITQLNATNNDGKTALEIVLSRGRIDDDMVLLLIRAGVNVNTIFGNGRNVLMEALTHSNVDFVNELLELGADVNVIDNEGRTSLMLACMYENSSETIATLIERGVDVNRVDNNGKSAIMLYLSADFMKGSNYNRYRINIPTITRELLQNGASVTLQDNEGKTFFDYAQALPSFSSSQILRMGRLMEKADIIATTLHMHETRKTEQPTVRRDDPSAPLRDYYDSITDERAADAMLKQSLAFLYPEINRDGSRPRNRSHKKRSQKKRSHKKRSQKKRSQKNKNDGQKKRSQKKRSQKKRSGKKKLHS
jgi:ankyrin repeat protein